MSFLRLHYLFFYLFLFLFPFNIRKAFLSDYSYFTGHLVEDATYFLNLSDILLFLTVVLGAFYIIGNKLQNDFVNFIRKYKYIFFMLGLIILWSLVGFWSAKDGGLVLFGTLKLIEFGLLFLYIAYFFRDYSRFLASWFIISVGGVIQFVIAITQYVQQKSLGLQIVGESILGKDWPGVAKILVDGEKVIRPYGTFGHPNILGGFLVFTLGASIAWWLYWYWPKKHSDRCILTKPFDYERIAKLIFSFIFLSFLGIMIFDHYLVTNHQGQILFWLALSMVFVLQVSPFEKQKLRNISHLFETQIFKRGLCLLIIIQFIALVLTYSRTAWLALGIMVLGMVIVLVRNMKHAAMFKFLPVFAIALIILFYLFPLKARIMSSADFKSQAIQDRIQGMRQAAEIIKTHPVEGVGSKNYVITIPDYESKNLEYWQYQPVHNGYLLILSEIGLVGFGFFAVFAFFVATHNRFFSREH